MEERRRRDRQIGADVPSTEPSGEKNFAVPDDDDLDARHVPPVELTLGQLLQCRRIE